MQPEDVVVITLDGLVHNVTERTAITISEQTGAIVSAPMVDPADPENVVMSEIRQPGPVVQHAGTRFTCGCGVAFDAKNADLGSDPRWTQGAAVDCPGC